MAVLYWLHFNNEADVFTQGYVGVASNIAKRLRSHKHRFKSIWEKVVVQQLVVSTQEYCFNLEQKLRPKRNIGWNKSTGGNRNNAMLAEENPNFGKIGENAPNFVGWYITPLGKFSRPEDAAKLHDCALTTIARRCKGRYANGKFLMPQKGYAFEQKVAG
jgi:hypothetical protein